MQGHDVDRTRTESGWVCECVVCHERFEAKRSDASICSPRCRKRLQRETEYWNNWIEGLDAWGEKLVSVAKTFRRSKRVYAAYLKLQRALQIAIEEFENA